MKEILITSSVLIIVLLILRTIFANNVRRTLIYGTWLLVALRLLLPFQIGQLSISVLNLFQPVTQAVTDISNKPVIEAEPVTPTQAMPEAQPNQPNQPALPDQPALPETPEQTPITPDVQLPGNDLVIEPEKPQQGVPEVQPPAQEQVQAPAEKTSEPVTVGQIAWAVWAIGAVVVAIWLSASNLYFVRSMKKSAAAVPLDSPVPVYVTEKAVSPCLVGLFRPAVCLTPEVAKDEQLRHYVMTHELTHYAHRDHIWSTARCLCLCLYWFNPLVWVAAWCSRRDCELACDEGAMARLGEEERIPYGKALLAVVQEASVPSRLMLTATTMAETKGQLRRRVHFIARKPHLSLFAAIALVLVCSLVVGCVATGATPQTVAEDPIDGPVITEPTESTTPTETVLPTDSTTVPTVVSSLATGATPQPTAENPIAESTTPTESITPTETVVPTTVPTVVSSLTTVPSTPIVSTNPTASQTTVQTTNPQETAATQVTEVTEAPEATEAPAQTTEAAQNATVDTYVPSVGFFTYSINTDGKTCTLQSCDPISSDLVLPDTLDGYTVTAIGDWAFDLSTLESLTFNPSLQEIGCHVFGGSRLKTIVLPDSVTKLGNAAFSGCTSLTQVVLSKGLTAIPNDLFAGSHKLASVEIPEGITSIGSYAFGGCSELAEIHLPQSITTIATSAFQSSGLEKIVIPNGVTVIERDVFSACINLKDVQIPDSVTQIKAGAFHGCGQLEQIRLPKGLTEISGGLFQSCSQLKQIEIPDGVTKIGPSAFSACHKLEQISLPDSVTSIGDYAFSSSKLKKILIPAGVTQIGNNAFSQCAVFDTIHYGGTMAQWNAINFMPRNHANVIIVHCTDGYVAIQP